MKSRSAAANQTFSIRNTTKGKLPRLPFVQIKEAVLGKKYDLSFVIAGDTLTQKLNRTYRSKNKPANVLSFPISKTEGELFLNLSRARKEARLFDKKFEEFVVYLFIHGLLHLKGFDHGRIMERLESKFLKRFGF